jgi:hypothetical protein
MDATDCNMPETERSSSMRNILIVAIVCLMAIALATSRGSAYPAYATATGKPCGYCHIDPAGGGPRTPDGEYYKTYGVLPPPPTVTSITVASGPNSGTTSITNLAGTTFLTGATVKLKRAGYPDITATNVTVPSPTKITCSLDLTGKQVGLYDVNVTNSDGLSGTESAGFGVTLPNTASLVTAGNRCLSDPIMETASTGWRMCVSGVVQIVDASTFTVNDGSGSTVKVFAPGYTGLVNGSYVSAIGTADVGPNPKALVSSAAQITKYR